MSEAVAYEVFYNADLTEGRGPMKSMGLFRTGSEVDEAVADKSYWIMGVQHNHEVFKLTVPVDETLPATREQVFGYRGMLLEKRGVRGYYSYGWLDLRDVPNPAEDPDYAEYMRLKHKFDNL